MKRLLRYLVLPSEVTSFEEFYLRRMNRIGLVFFWLHIPAFLVVAALSGTSIPLAAVLSIAAVTGPTLGYFAFRARPRVVSMIYGFTAMLMGGVLVYIGQGPMQIEMHFYFFVLIALLAVFGNPMVIMIAAVTVAAHHLVVWLVLPEGVFNYEASIWAVAVHAIFVVLESVAACFVARSFFDNVIGLEWIVTRRTADLDQRNQDMALILDNVAQGFVTIGLDGSIGPERSASLSRWFGKPGPDVKVWTYLAGYDPNLEAWMELGFQTIEQQIFPIEIAIGQLPERLSRDGRHFRVEYQAIGTPVNALLLVITDITSEIARQRAEGAQRELITVIEKAYRDRAGFMAFVREADATIRDLAERDDDLAVVRRRVHTLKGNAGLFGVASVAELCHELENAIEETRVAPDASAIANLVSTWRGFRGHVERLLGLSTRRTILIDWDEYQSVLAQIAEPEPAWAKPIRRWGQDATRTHLERFGDQARQLAQRLGKPELEIEICDSDLRLEERFAPMWSALVHTVRNAVDHGIETPEQRRAAGKPERGVITFSTQIVDDVVEIGIHDDGAGVDWPRVAAKARDLGLPSDTQAELQEALFASGLSTATEITETSGRGVGMAALRSTCAELGGRVELSSVRGVGTSVRCVIPLNRRARRPSALAS